MDIQVRVIRRGDAWCVEKGNQVPELEGFYDEDETLDELYVSLCARVPEHLGVPPDTVTVKMLAFESPI
jgi:hypothetical protein